MPVAFDQHFHHQESTLHAYVLVLSHSVVSDSRPHRLEPAGLLCPWDSPGKNTGVGCHFLLQGIFLMLGSDPVSPAPQADSLPLSHLGSLTEFQLLNAEGRREVENHY